MFSIVFFHRNVSRRSIEKKNKLLFYNIIFTFQNAELNIVKKQSVKCFSDLICLQNTPCGSNLQILNIGCIFYQTLLFEIFSLKSGNNFPKLMLLIWHTLYPELVMSSLSYLFRVQSHSDFFFFKDDQQSVSNESFKCCTDTKNTLTNVNRQIMFSTTCCHFLACFSFLGIFINTSKEVNPWDQCLCDEFHLKFLVSKATNED